MKNYVEEVSSQLGLCVRKTEAEKSRDYRDVIVFKKSSVFKMFAHTEQ